MFNAKHKGNPIDYLGRSSQGQEAGVTEWLQKTARLLSYHRQGWFPQVEWEKATGWQKQDALLADVTMPRGPVRNCPSPNHLRIEENDKICQVCRLTRVLFNMVFWPVSGPFSLK